MRAGQPVCVIETSKSAIEIVSPGAGTLCHLYREGEEVELGRRIAVIASTEAEVEALDRERAAEPDEPPQSAPANATRRAIELAARHGIDLASIRKSGFITADDVEALIAGPAPASAGAITDETLLAGISIEGVTLPACFELADEAGRLDDAFFARLRDDPRAFAALPSDERIDLYRRHGARLGESVTLGERTVIVAPRIVLGDGVRIGDDSTVACSEIFAVDALTASAAGLTVTCRRAFIGSNGWIGRHVRIGGGGSREPWATLAVGDLVFIGDEVVINPCRPVLIGREVFLTLRSVIVTHNIGHSALEGFENRFAGVVLEDRSQVGIGAVVYAGCRVGYESIVGSNSYVVSDIPPGKLALGVPARVVGSSSRPLTDSRRRQLVETMLDELEELLKLRGTDAERVETGGARGILLRTQGTVSYVLFVERLDAAFRAPETEGEVVVLTIGMDGDPPRDCVTLDLIARRVHGSGGAVLDAVREFCRKRGIRFQPGPWRYRSGLI